MLKGPDMSNLLAILAALLTYIINCNVINIMKYNIQNKLYIFLTNSLKLLTCDHGNVTVKKEIKFKCLINVLNFSDTL